jgi:hypothetical protein
MKCLDQQKSPKEERKKLDFKKKMIMRREKMFKKVAKRNCQERNTRRTGCLIYARSVRMIKGKKNKWEESLSIEVYLKRSRF